MSRDPRYQKLLNSKRWMEVKRVVWQRAGGLCERCRREGIEAGVLPDGYITPGVDCHHIVPVESAKTEQEMERLAYDVSNIRLLCIPCHIKTHQEMRSHTKEKVKENKERARRRFLEANDPNYGEKADAYMKNLEEQAKMEDIIYPNDDPNYNEDEHRDIEGAATLDAQPEDRPLAGSDRPIQQPLQRTGVREFQWREGLGGNALAGGDDHTEGEVHVCDDGLRKPICLPICKTDEE